MKFTRKLIPAVAMLVVSATMMSTASFAWFSMNRTVTATGMQATAVSPVNLQISVDDNTYTNAVTSYTNVTGKLLPASTVDPTDINNFYAVKAGTGTVINAGAGGILDDSSDIVFQSVPTEVTDSDGYYIDYTFYFQLTSAVSENTNIYLSELTFTESTTHLNQAARVALLNESNGLVAIYAAAVDTANAIGELDTDGTIKTLTATGAIAANDQSKVFTIAAGATKTSVTLRLWIEGQDEQCVNANAGSTINFQVAFAVK